MKCVAIMPGGCAQSAPACTVGCVIYLKNDRCLSLGLGSGSENHFSNDDFRRRFSCASTSSADQLKYCCLMQHEHFHACTENKGPRICEESGAFELEAACLKNGISASCGGVKTTWPKEQCGESCKDLFRRLMLASWTKCLCGVATSCSTSPTKEECCACQKMCSSPESILNALPAVCKSVPGIADNYANNCQGLVNSNHGCSMIGVSGQINCGGKITVGTDPLLEY
ncbi:hypothetical protein JNK13_04900 [bacterium]|nr:hypothetical protein [bacterium]